MVQLTNLKSKADSKPSSNASGNAGSATRTIFIALGLTTAFIILLLVLFVRSRRAKAEQEEALKPKKGNENMIESGGQILETNPRYSGPAPSTVNGYDHRTSMTSHMQSINHRRSGLHNEASNAQSDMTPLDIEPSFHQAQKVNYPFHPRQDDEISLALGDMVHILEEFEDGWATGYRLNKQGKPEASGIFPMNCLDPEEK